MPKCIAKHDINCPLCTIAAATKLPRWCLQDEPELLKGGIFTWTGWYSTLGHVENSRQHYSLRNVPQGGNGDFQQEVEVHQLRKSNILLGIYVP